MRLIIFDIDGTLVDSQNDIVTAQGRAFAMVGLPPPTRQQSLSVVGLSLIPAFAALVGPGGPVERLAEAYIAAWGEIRQTPGHSDVLYAGAAETIAALAERDEIRLGIATGKSRRGVERILATQSWSGIFATIQTADGHPSKPDPSMIRAAMQETGAAPAATMMIGDTTYDVAMALAAGVRPVGVSWGYHSAAELRVAGADVIVDDFAELRALLDTP